MRPLVSIDSFFVILCTRRAQLDRCLCSNHIWGSINGQINALSLLFLYLFFDPKVCDPELILRTPSTHSSMNVRDRVCFPSPHISNLSVEVTAFLLNAAGAFSPTFPCSEGSINVTETTNRHSSSKSLV